jgi:hypothetical protein
MQEHEQGSVQGALYGARALASGTGPLLFAGLFSAFTQTESPLPYFPGAPFMLGTLLMVVAIGVAATIPSTAGGSGGSIEGRQGAHCGGGGDSSCDGGECVVVDDEGLVKESTRAGWPAGEGPVVGTGGSAVAASVAAVRSRSGDAAAAMDLEGGSGGGAATERSRLLG